MIRLTFPSLPLRISKQFKTAKVNPLLTAQKATALHLREDVTDGDIKTLTERIGSEVAVMVKGCRNTLS